jgi:hypothetical protein
MLVEIFYYVDEFCKIYATTVLKEATQARGPECRLKLSEIMTIAIYFHHSGYKDFKAYYTKHVLVYLRTAFRGLVSYNRFIELLCKSAIPLMTFSKIYSQSACSGVSFIDSFKLAVCHNRRIYNHRVFKGLAQRGKTSMGWFFGFKIHFVISHQGNIIDFYLTPGNVADNNENVIKKITNRLFGKLFGDKGYIVNERVFRELFDRGIQLFTRLRSNMSNKLLLFQDKLLLNKRGIIESTIGILKYSLSIEHSRHRSPINFVVHLATSFAAYAFRPAKPTINLDYLILQQ